MKKVHALLALIGASCLSLAVSAAPITTLFNTGVNASGTPLANGTIGDPHYTLTSVPAGSTTDIRVITSAGGFPIVPNGPYIGDNALSAWIRPNNNPTNPQDTDPVGVYVYRTAFDLTGFDISTASITGGWSTDNNGLDILINGVSLGFTTAINQFQLGFAPFTVNSGFVAGVNTLDFRVNNAAGATGNPTALRVQMTGTADPVQVPEPGTLALLGIGLAGLAAARRRK